MTAESSRSSRPSSPSSTMATLVRKRSAASSQAFGHPEILEHPDFGSARRVGFQRAQEFADFLVLALLDRREPLPQRAAVEEEILDAQRRIAGERIPDRLAHPGAAAAVARASPRELPEAPGRLMERSRHERLAADREPLERVGHARLRETRRLEQQRGRMHGHMPREERLHPGDERAGPELGEGVMPPVGRDDVVPGLSSRR